MDQGLLDALTFLVYVIIGLVVLYAGAWAIMALFVGKIIKGTREKFKNDDWSP